MKLTSLLTLLVLMTGAAGASELAAPSPAAKSRHAFQFSLDSGYRQGEFQWTIAGNNSGSDPNILSDLDWQDLRIVPVGLKAEVDLWGSWKLRAAGSYGHVFSGKSRDSDYDGNNRSGEFSRSYADAAGSYTLDASFELGYAFHPTQRLTLTPWLGVAWHEQFLRMRNGVSVLDDEGYTGKFGGLDSSYDAKWLGGSLGLEAKYSITDTFRLFLGARGELLQYEARGDWNLRDDSRYFDHKADGYAITVKAGVEWDLRPTWTLGVAADWTAMRTSAGEDRSHITGGGTDTTRMNGARWQSFGITTGLTFRF